MRLERDKMRRFRELFTKEILDRAAEMVISGKVKKPVWTDEGELLLTVRDDRNYETFVDVDMEGYLLSLKCSCDEGRQRIPCVHMAASLFYFEDITDEEVYYDNVGMTKKEKELLPDFDANMPMDVRKADGSEDGKKAKIIPMRQNNKGEIMNLPALGERFCELETMQKDARKERADSPDYVNDRSGSEYRYFRYEEYKKQLRFVKDKMDAALRLYRNQVSSFEIQTGYETSMTGAQEMIGIATLKGSDRTGSYVNWGARIHFGHNRLLNAVCETWGCRHHGYPNENIRHEMCEHTLACYLCLKDYLEKNSIGDSTNASGIRFLEYIDRNKAVDGIEQVRDLHIEPVLNIFDYDRLFLKLAFKAGTNKLYMIKDITDFIGKVKDKEEYTFGKNSTVRLSESRLDERGRKWFELMCRCNDDLQRAGRIANDISSSRSRYYSGREVIYTLGKEMILKNELLDNFFETGKGMTIDCKRDDGEHKRSSQVKLEEHRLPLALTINKDTDDKTGEFRGILLEGDTPETFSGKKYTYFIEDGKFVRVSSEDNGLVKSLLAEEQGGYIRIQIGRKHLKDFYAKSLPVLKTIAFVTENDAEEIHSYIPPEAEYAFFLDVDEGLIICRGDVYYGARIFSLTDVIDNQSNLSDKYDSIRDMQGETDACNKLYEYFSEYDPVREVFFCEKDDETVFRLIDHGVNEIMEIGEVYSTERFKRLIVHKDVQFTMGVSVESNIMNLDINSDELSHDELLQIFYGYKKKQNFVKLKNGDFIKLDPEDNLALLNEMLESMGVNIRDFVKGKMHIPTYRALYLDKMLEQMQGVYADRDKHFKRLIKEFNSIENSDFELPEGMKGILRNYQQLGYKWLRTLDQYGFGGILADDMGLGKTLQVISVIKAVKDEVVKTDPADASVLDIKDEINFRSCSMTSLVVCPASLVYNWGEELRRFAPELKYTLVLGTQDERKILIEGWKDSDVLVTSYDLLKRDIDCYSGKRFRFQIIDEAQYIKNHNTEAAKTVKLIEADTKYALTGTPIENRLSELWSIFDYLLPGLLYGYGDFRSRLETPIVKYEDKEAGETLRRMVHPFILRRVKSDVLKDLPDKLEETRYAGMDDAQRKLYDAQVVRMKKKLDEKDDAQFNKSKIEILAELTRIRQICCDPSLCFENYDGGSAKREACMELLASLNDGGHKTLLFSQFTSMLAILEKELNKAGLKYYKITGETSKEARIDMVKRFNTDDTPVFLISLKAGGTGLNLTGADAVIHYDPWWNVAAQNQATDRAHRIGQTKVVTVYRMILKNTIEEKILEMQEQKKKLAEDILSGENISSASLTREDLIKLLD